MRIRLLVGSIVVLGAVSACGAGPDKPRSAASRSDTKDPASRAAQTSGGDPCALLTSGEIGAVVGATVDAGKKDATSFPGRDCQWQWESGMRNVVLLIHELGSQTPQSWVATAQRQFESQSQEGKVKLGGGIEVDKVPPDKRTTFVTLSGVGDAGWAEEMADGSVQQLAGAVAGSKSAVAIAFLKAVPKAGAIDLLKKAVGRLS